MAQQGGRTFEDMQFRLEQIVEEVSAEDISLDDALALYEEAVKLGLAACDLSESDVEAYLAATSSSDADHEEGVGGEEGAAEAAPSVDVAAAAVVSPHEEDGAASADSPVTPAEQG